MVYIAARRPHRFLAEQLAMLSSFAELCARKVELSRLSELSAKAQAAEAGLGPHLVRK